MKCKDCKNLKNRSTYGQCYAHEGCKICRDSNDGCIMFEPAIQTNGDRLRAMSNEELAEILVYSEDDEWYGRQWFSFDGDHIRNAFPTKQDAIKSTIDWLNSPAESEVNHE